MKQVISSAASGVWEPCGRHPERSPDCQHCQRGINHKMKQSFSEVMTPGMMKGSANTPDEPRLHRILMEIMACCLHKQAAKSPPPSAGLRQTVFPCVRWTRMFYLRSPSKALFAFFLSTDSTQADSNAEKGTCHPRSCNRSVFFFFSPIFVCCFVPHDL